MLEITVAMLYIGIETLTLDCNYNVTFLTGWSSCCQKALLI